MIHQNFGFNQYYPVASTPSYDPDAQAFITATGISGTDATAINTLVLDLKYYSLWTLLRAAYPLVGGTASSTKYNLKDPRDLDAAFRMTWSGGITYTNGAQGNGTTGVGDTNFVPSAYSMTNMHMSIYRITFPSTDHYDMGSTGYSAAGINTGENMIARYGGNQYYGFGSVSANAWCNYSEATTTGFFTALSDGSTQYMYKNGSVAASCGKTIDPSILAIAAMGTRNSGGIFADSPANYGWFSIGDYMTSTEVGNFNTCIQTFETTLGRNV
jgi:hypothetical protein